MINQVIRFSIIGVIGFIVDASVLTLCYSTIKLNVYLSRFFSFSLAVLVTWLLNRKITFCVAEGRGQSKKAEYINYNLVQACGALMNLTIFSLLVSVNDLLLEYPVVPLAIAAVIAMIFNFLALKRWVYCGAES